MNAPGRRRDRTLDLLLAEERALADLPISRRHAAEFQVRKWAAIREFLEYHPFQLSDLVPRAEQWERVVRHLHDVLDEAETLSWAATQGEIARNRAAGIQDLRPRGDGPCHQVLLRWVRGREYKARAVLAWVEAADEDGTGAGSRNRDP